MKYIALRMRRHQCRPDEAGASARARDVGKPRAKRALLTACKLPLAKAEWSGRRAGRRDERDEAGQPAPTSTPALADASQLAHSRQSHRCAAQGRRKQLDASLRGEQGLRTAKDSVRVSYAIVARESSRRGQHGVGEKGTTAGGSKRYTEEMGRANIIGVRQDVKVQSSTGRSVATGEIKKGKRKGGGLTACSPRVRASTRPSA